MASESEIERLKAEYAEAYEALRLAAAAGKAAKAAWDAALQRELEAHRKLRSATNGK